MNRRLFTRLRRLGRLSALGLWFAPFLVSAQPTDTNLHPLLEALVAVVTNGLQGAAGSNSIAPASPTNAVAEVGAANAADRASAKALEKYRDQQEEARNLINTRQFEMAEVKLVKLLAESVPDPVRQQALLDLGEAVAAEDDLPRAQSIYSQYLDRWPTDVRVPEILLCQGKVFRQMGLGSLALTKFYDVMTAALSLKSDQMDYYRRLVLQAQMEIADTYFQMGRYADAAEYFSRLLKQSDPALNRPLMQFRLVRSLAATSQAVATVAAAQDFLAHYPDDPEAPEARYYLAQALKAQGQTAEALRQVLAFLRTEERQSHDHPDVWAYWQQRVGNEIGNSFYKDGDYVTALLIYLRLAQLDSAPAWQLPVEYQVGITYEHLLQPQKAMETYTDIVTRETAVGTNATPDLQTVFEMARWRIGFLKWQDKAELVTHSLSSSANVKSGPITNSPAQ